MTRLKFYLTSFFFFFDNRSETRKLISYRTGRYRRNLPYQCLGRYRNALVSFRFKYRLYRSRFEHIGINTRFWPENKYRAKQKKTQKNPQISTSTSSLLPLFFLLFFVFVSATHFFLFSFVSLASVSTTPSSSSFNVCLYLF